METTMTIILHGVRGVDLDWVGGDAAWWDEVVVVDMVVVWVGGWSIPGWWTARVDASRHGESR